MVRLEDIKKGVPLVGLEAAAIATVASVEVIDGGAVTVYYRTPDGAGPSVKQAEFIVDAE